MRKHLMARRRQPMQMRMREGKGARQHLELRSADVGVSVLDHDSAGKFIAIKYEVDPMELEGTYNGAFEELTVAQANHRIEQLQRGLRLIERAKKQEENPDDARFKDVAKAGSNGSEFDAASSIPKLVRAEHTSRKSEL